MFILQATSIKKMYGVRTILEFDSLQVYEGDKIGIVGLNGAGKSTLMGILCGEITPDSGTVITSCEPAFIRQLPQLEGTLSGGENAKKQIQQQTFKSDQIVFADEPTANLDADGVAWIRAKLRSARTVLLISHDRELLDDLCTKIIEVRDGKLFFYTGSYAEYEQKVAEARDQQQAEYESTQKKKAQLLAAVQGRDQQVARQRQKKRAEMAKNSSEARLGGHKRAASMQKQQRIAKVLESRIDRLPQVEKLRELPKLSIDFSLTQPPGNKLVIIGERISFSYGEHLVLDGASFEIKNKAKVAVTGKNGAGKSTLLKLIYDGCDAIRPAPKLRPGFLYQSFENLDMEATVLENVLSTSIQEMAAARSVLAGLLFRGDDVYKKAGVLSGGEKMRLSLAKLITANNNALLLDEPTNYLDIRSLEAVERVLCDYPGTLLIVSHDRRFVDAVAEEELRVENGKINPVRAEAPPSPAQRTLLELRRVRLLGEISSAPPEQKIGLEEKYARVIAALKDM